MTSIAVPLSKRHRLASLPRKLVTELYLHSKEAAVASHGVISSTVASHIVSKAEKITEFTPDLWPHVIDQLRADSNIELTESALKILNAPTDDSRVTSLRPLLPAGVLHNDIPMTPQVEHLVQRTRREVSQICAEGGGSRVVAVVGPCSIHDPGLAMDYAKRLKKIASKDVIRDNVLVIMRVYFEKPRTTVGWKGLINDPDLNGTFKINKGLRIARQLLHDINALGLPVGCEFLDTISPQYTADLVSWGAIGARTTECQLHRELASGLSCPIGFKNGTSGSVKIAIDACLSSSSPHRFLGITKNGLAAIVSTSGNNSSHVILRGGADGPNFKSEHVKACAKQLDAKGFNKRNIIIDCSHGNSNKNHENQPHVLRDICGQIMAGETRIAGVMVESNVKEGKQTLKPGVTPVEELEYGVSVTDACIDLDTTEQILLQLAQANQLGKAQQP